jgi:drug/metabolite transporter (DMT)-like permease
MQALVIRAFYLAAGCFGHLLRDKKSIIDIPEHIWKFVLLRALFGFCSSAAFFLAIEYLPLSMAVSLYFTSPILTAIVCYFALGEKLARLEIIGIFSAMFGVILMTSPEFLYEPEIKTYPRLKHYDENTEKYDYTFGFMWAMIGSLTNAFVFLVCRKIGKEVHQSIHPFYFALASIMGGLMCIAFFDLPLNPLTEKDFILLSLCGIFSWIQQEGQSIALQVEKGGRSAAINYLVVFISFIFDALVYGEAVKWTDLAGAFFIIICTLSNAMMKCFGKTN